MHVMTNSKGTSTVEDAGEGDNDHVMGIDYGEGAVRKPSEL